MLQLRLEAGNRQSSKKLAIAGLISAGWASGQVVHLIAAPIATVRGSRRTDRVCAPSPRRSIQQRTSCPSLTVPTRRLYSEEEGPKMTTAPHVPTLPERLATASRCGARRRHDDGSCQQPAMANGRCRFHGERARVQRLLEGAERARQAALRHGFYTAEAKAERRIARAALAGLRAALASVDRNPV